MAAGKERKTNRIQGNRKKKKGKKMTKRRAASLKESKHNSVFPSMCFAECSSMASEAVFEESLKIVSKILPVLTCERVLEFMVRWSFSSLCAAGQTVRGMSFGSVVGQA